MYKYYPKFVKVFQNQPSRLDLFKNLVDTISFIWIKQSDWLSLWCPTLGSYLRILSLRSHPRVLSPVFLVRLNYCCRALHLRCLRGVLATPIVPHRWQGFIQAVLMSVIRHKNFNLAFELWNSIFIYTFPLPVSLFLLLLNY